MKCASCGAEISEDSKFCGICGTEVEQAAPDTGDVFEDNTDPVGAEYEEEVENPESDAGTDAEETPEYGEETDIGLEYEQTDMPKPNSAKVAILCVLGLILLLGAVIGTLIMLNSGNISGVWEKESNSIFDMFDSTYIEFSDNGKAKYYSDFFFSRELEYSYNKLSNTITFSDKTNTVVWHIHWQGRGAFVVEESGDVYKKVSDTAVPDTGNKSDEQYNTGPAVEF